MRNIINTSNGDTSVLEMLLITLGVTFLMWLGQFHWRRRRLYQVARKYNGPFAIPFVGNSLTFAGSTRDILNAITRLGTIYDSPVRVWLGHKLIFGITEPDQLEIILNSYNALGKEDLYKFAIPFVGTGLFTAPVQKWKRHRKIIMPTFNQKILNGFVEVFVEKSEILVEQFKTQTGKPIDAFHYLSRCTLDIICETAMGVTVNAQTEESDYMKCANRAMHIVFLRMLQVWLRFEFIFNLTSLAKEQEDIATKMFSFTGNVVREKREAYERRVKENKESPEALLNEAPEKRTTFLEHLIQLSEEGAKFTDEELREEVDTFMIAGSDTTATMNSFTLIMLGMHPEIQEKVYEEVMDVLGPEKAVDFTDLCKFEYMERVIKETMRIFPVGPVIVRAIDEDLTLNDDRVIPKGSSVAVIIMCVHRNPKFWPDPMKFDPDRFLPEEVAKRHPYSYLPFSGGPRNCVGPKYAMMAMKALLATVIRKYKISTEYKSTDDIELKVDITLKPINGYNISVELRE